MINVQKPFDDLKPIDAISVKEKKSLILAIQECRKVLYFNSGFCEAQPNEELNKFSDLIQIYDTKYSFDLDGYPLSINRLFEAQKSENHLNDQIAISIFQYINWSQNIKSINLSSLEPFYVYSSKRKTNLYRGRNEYQIKSFNTNLTLYTAPSSSKIIEPLLTDLNLIIKSSGRFEDLTHLALVHFQFRALAPYLFMNGHIARFITKHSISQIHPSLYALPLSAVIFKDKENYHTLMRDIVIDQEYEEWCVYLINAIKVSGEVFLDKYKKFQALKRLNLEILSKYTEYDLPAYELNSILFSCVYIKPNTIIKELVCHRHTAYMYLKHLTSMGILIEKTSGREKLYWHKDLYDIFSD
ncbi:MAG: hypothetical protein R2852_01525 [Bacteroidia bacterium]